MGDVLEDATLRVRATSLVLVGALVAMVLPSLLMTTTQASGSVAAVVMALTLAACVRLSMRGWAFAASTHASACPTGDDVAPIVTARVTDPVHHPLRPRAPGTA
jgi:hypothetical protein